MFDFDEKTIIRKLKIFGFTFGAMFVMMALINLGIRLPKFNFHLINPSVKADVFDTIAPKLDQTPNHYHLSKQTSLINTAYADSPSDYDNAPSYVAVDFSTGKVILDKASDEKLPIASLTKIITATVALDLASPNEVFTVPDSATHVIPTVMGVSTGEKFTLDELLHAMLETSANDSAQVIRDGIDAKYGGNIFERAMNEKAKYLGLSNSHFANPQGFDDPNNYSTASDLAVLTHYALTNYPEIASIVKIDYTVLPATATHKKYNLPNWQALLGVYPGVYGVKIGNTDDAGKTTVVVSEREGHQVLVVLLGAPDIVARDTWTASLLDQSFFTMWGLEPVGITREALQEKYDSWYIPR
jgi:serine-type D-Ala-D-Ala carboxypeptidase (penicillin-binding protein 5/6)